MRTPLLSQSMLAEPKPRPFPTRGVPGGWHDPWDADPLEAMVSGLRARNARRRDVIEADGPIEILAPADDDWKADAAAPV